MNKLKIKSWLLMNTFFLYSCISNPSATISAPSSDTDLNEVEQLATPYDNSSCIKTFNDFAYTFWSLSDDVKDVQVVIPAPPWQKVDVVMSQQFAGYYPPYASDVILTRTVMGVSEIWVEQKLLPISGVGTKKIFNIYQPGLSSWKTISGNISNTDLYVKDLFVTKNGDVWGSTGGEYFQDAIMLEENIPVLSIYNDQTQQFEFAKGVFEIKLSKPNDSKSLWSPYLNNIEIVLDREQDVFWIFIEKDGVYRYDINIQENQKWIDADLSNFFGPIISPDGSIFVDDFRPEKNNEPYFHLYEGSLLRFNPNTKKNEPLSMPNEPWPWFSGWLVSKDGTLWLGSIGYKTTDQSWHLLYPDTEKYFENIGNPTFATPHLMLESSNGLLWYKKYLDMGINHEGTAWYDPRTGQGCMFTNLAVNIIEDSKQQLWLVANGELYKNLLRP